MHSFLQAAHDTWLGDVTRQNSSLFTLGLIIHFVGLCMLMGAMLVIDLRLLGVGKRMPIGAALSLLPFAITGFVLNLLTGIMFFCFDPFGYWGNPAFKLKMLLVLIAGVNALAFTVTSHRRLAVAPDDHNARVLVKMSAALSLALWFAIILFGRLIVAFQGSSDF